MAYEAYIVSGVLSFYTNTNLKFYRNNKWNDFEAAILPIEDKIFYY